MCPDVNVCLLVRPPSFAWFYRVSQKDTHEIHVAVLKGNSKGQPLRHFGGIRLKKGPVQIPTEEERMVWKRATGIRQKVWVCASSSSTPEASDPEAELTERLDLSKRVLLVSVSLFMNPNRVPSTCQNGSQTPSKNPL